MAYPFHRAADVPLWVLTFGVRSHDDQVCSKLKGPAHDFQVGMTATPHAVFKCHGRRYSGTELLQPVTTTVHVGFVMRPGVEWRRRHTVHVEQDQPAAG